MGGVTPFLTDVGEEGGVNGWVGKDAAWRGEAGRSADGALPFRICWPKLLAWLRLIWVLSDVYTLKKRKHIFVCVCVRERVHIRIYD